jgi:hypothetical protein
VGSPRDRCTIQPVAAGPCLGAVAPTFGTLRVAPNGSVLRGSGLGLLNGGPSVAWLPGVEQFLPLFPPAQPAVGGGWSLHSSPTLATGDAQLEVDADEVLQGYVGDFGQRLPSLSGVMNVPMDLDLNVRRAAEIAGVDSSGMGADSPPRLRFIGANLVVRQRAEACDELYQVSNYGNFVGKVETAGFPGRPDRIATLRFNFELSLRRLDADLSGT